MDRKAFFTVSGALGLGPFLSGSADAAGVAQSTVHATYPAQDPALVREMVLYAHSDVDRVRELAEQYPELATASMDWGFGDWESALGAAAHMGRTDIAEVLLANGARPSLFSAAMLGQRAVVQALVEASPGIQGTPGPHGITLLAHARAGGEGALPVVEYLESVGGADPKPPSEPLSEEARRSVVGNYRYGAADDEVLEVTERDGALFIARRGHFGRMMIHQGDRVFSLGGASSVRVAFGPGDGVGRVATVTAGASVVKAQVGA